MKIIKDILALIVFLSVVGLVLYLGFNRPKETIRYEFETDTLYMRDTVRLPVPLFDTVYLARVDTVFIAQDTVEVAVPVPIHVKEYKTADYHAIIEGYNASLLSMTVYPQTKTIYNTEIRTRKEKTRFGIGPCVGFVITPDGKTSLAAGVSFQYNLITF